MKSRSPDFDLLLVTDRNQALGRDLLWVLEQALEGGVSAIQLREKNLGGRELFRLAEKTKSLCGRYDARLLINDRIDVALAIDADGVQLGAASLPIKAARQLLGSDKLIGASTHFLAEVHEAYRSGADFALFGPVHSTPSKVAYGEPQGLVQLQKVVEKSSLPIYAIGGINAGNISEAKMTGIRGVALISAILGCAEPKTAAQRILSALER